MAKPRHKKNISENLHTPTTEGFFLVWSPYTPGNSNLASYFPLKNLAFNPPTPPPPTILISIYLPWGGSGYLLEVHNRKACIT